MAFSFAFPEPPTPPTLAHLLQTNVPLSSMETHLATSYINELESQIALLDETITSLQFRRADLLKSVKTHKAILAPVRRLPSEILGEIFLFVLSATFRITTVAKPPMTQHAPWLFTRICRHWSAVALATPALWSMFLLDLDQDFVDPNRAVHTGAVSLTKLCLERSGRNVPLNVHILQGERHNKAHLVQVLDALLSLSGRWGMADFRILSPFSSTCILLQQITSARSSFSALTTLLLTIILRLSNEGSNEFREVFADVPRLRFLAAHCWDTKYADETDYVRSPFSLPWHQLTHVSTTFASNTEALSVLRGLSNTVIQCDFAFAKNEILSAYSSDNPLCLPYMRSLELSSGAAYEKHTCLLDFLETPRLQTLLTDEAADEEAVLELIARSHCEASLASFYFHTSSVNHSMFLQLTQKMPHLASLGFGNLSGTLLPGSSVPEFIQAFSAQWLGATEEKFPGRSFHVQMVDEELSKQVADSLTLTLVPMQKDGLFITVSFEPDFPQLFDYFGYQ